MKNMKIRTKLIVGFSIPVLLTILTVLVGVFITKECVSVITEMNQTSADELHQHFVDSGHLGDAEVNEFMEIVN